MKYRKLSELKKLEGNPRLIKDNQFKILCESIRNNKEYFEARPVILSDRTGSLVIIAGNMRYEAAKAVGLKEVPTFLIENLTGEKEKEIIIRDNVQNGEWDMDLLSAWDDLPLTDWGVDLPEDWLAPDGGAGGLTDPDAIPEPPKVAITKLGDIWLCGKHRVMCGDSTKAEDVERLMDGVKADMVFTDPPYGISLDVNTDVSNRSTPKFKKPNQKNYTQIIGDDADYDPAHIFRDFGYCKEIFIWGADYYAERIEKRNEGCFFVWDKRQESSDSMIGSCFELCWSKQKHKREVVRVLWCGLLGTESQDVRNRIHPTQKPIQLCSWFIEKFSKEDDVIADLFGGSGSTLIAAEQTGRTAYLMEIDPLHVDVTVQRWEDYTGGKAVLE